MCNRIALLHTLVVPRRNQLLAARPHDLLGPDEVAALVEDMKGHSSGLIETVTPQPLSLAALTRLLRALLEDGIALSHPLPIFAELSRAVQQTQDHGALIDMVRADLGAALVARVCPPGGTLPVITLDGGLESAILSGLSDPVTGQPMIEPDLSSRIAARVRSLIDARPRGAVPPAFVVQPPTRRAIAALLRLRAPECLVLSIAELPASQSIEVIEVIGAPEAQLEPPANQSQFQPIEMAA